jgi:hypothetical protein
VTESQPLLLGRPPLSGVEKSLLPLRDSLFDFLSFAHPHLLPGALFLEFFDSVVRCYSAK